MNLNDLEWALARGSGMAALVLLTVVVGLGLALSLRMSSDAWPRVLTTAGHRQLTNLALLMTGLHLAMLLVDADAAMSVADLAIPFASGYRPVATALGVLGLYVLLVIWVSTLMRARLGQRRWRGLRTGRDRRLGARDAARGVAGSRHGDPVGRVHLRAGRAGRGNAVRGAGRRVPWLQRGVEHVRGGAERLQADGVERRPGVALHDLEDRSRGIGPR